MKVISYNIFQGGLDGDKKGERLEHIIDVIRSAETDVVGIQEACFWSYNDFEILKYVASKTGHSFFTMTPASLDVGETHPYSTAILSKHRILKETNHNYFRNAATEVLIDTPLGEIDIISLHLSPFTEEERLIEVEELLKSTAKYNNVIIMGDFNSLSVHDKYEGYVAEFNEKQMKKFVTNGMLRYDVINRFLEAGFQDIFLNQSNNVYTVPTKFNQDAAHEAPLRLDYILTTRNLSVRITDATVMRDELVEKASDHYPLEVRFP